MSMRISEWASMRAPCQIDMHRSSGQVCYRAHSGPKWARHDEIDDRVSGGVMFPSPKSDA